MKRAIFIKGGSMYGATRVFTDEMAQAFARHGWDAAVVDAAAGDLAQDLTQALAAGPVEFVYTVGGLGDMRDSQGRSLGEVVGAPHVLQMVDYPLSDPRLNQISPLTALLFVDRSHADAVRGVYGDQRFAYLGFCPHAAVGDPAPAQSADVYERERPLGLMFAGSFYEDQPPPWATAAPQVRQVFETAAEIAAGPAWTPAAQALEQALTACGHDPASPQAAALRPHASLIHEHLRRTRRRAFLDALGQVGATVHVFGAGWDKAQTLYPSFTFHGPLELADLIVQMRRARLVLSVNANFGHGSHERPLTAMLAGAAVLCDRSAWWHENFSTQALATFEWSDLAEIAGQATTLAADCAKLSRQAQAGLIQTSQAHRFDHRIELVLTAAAAAAARAAGCDRATTLKSN